MSLLLRPRVNRLEFCVKASLLWQCDLLDDSFTATFFPVIRTFLQPIPQANLEVPLSLFFMFLKCSRKLCTSLVPVSLMNSILHTEQAMPSIYECREKHYFVKPY